MAGRRLRAHSRASGWPTIRRAGFTLIEILVVVAVIALLVAILVPSLRQAREQAKTAVCGSNLKTTGHAVFYYTEDNRGHFPDSGEWAERVHLYVERLRSGTKRFDDRLLLDAGGVDQVVDFYICPADPILAPTTQVKRRFGDEVRTANYRVSFAFSAFLSWRVINLDVVLRGERPRLNRLSLGDDGLGNFVFKGLQRTSDIERQAAVVMLADAGNDDVGVDAPEATQWDFDERIDPGPSPEVLEVHHGKGNNFLFADQHVEFKKVHDPSVPQRGVPRFPWAWVPVCDLAPPS